MSDIETIAIQTYQDNMQYFLDFQPELYKLLEYFNKALQNGDYPANYDLEYTAENYFDISILKTNNFFYGCDSLEYSKELIKNITYKKDEHIFETTLAHDVSDSKEFKQKSNELIADVLPIMNYVNKYSQITDEMKEIQKFIFIGTGLGLQISELQKSLNLKNILIIEDDLELFKLSLFTTSYKDISSKSKLYFSIAQDENMFLDSMKKFLSNSFYDNRYIKYNHFPLHDTNKIKHIQNAIASQSYLVFPYSMALQKLIRPLEYISDNFNILNISKRFEQSIFFHKPVLLLAAGPSLKENIEFVKKNKNKFIIACVSATLKTLYKHNIKPDIVSHIDGIESQDDSCMVHFEGIDTKEFLKDTIFIFNPFTPAVLRNMFNKENIFLYEDGAEYFNGFGSLSAPCVGSTTLALMLIFNTQDLYLLGLDLALNQKSGDTHSDIHNYNHTHDLANAKNLDTNISLTKNILQVKGNKQDLVFTTPMLHLSVQVMQTMIPVYKDKNQNIYNLGDGAKFANTKALNINSINTKKLPSIDKNQIFKSIKLLLTNHSASKISNSNFLDIKNKLIYSKDLINKIKEYKQNIHYLNLLKDTTSKSKEAKDISNILFSYYEYIFPFIFDLLNTKNLQNEINHTREINNMLITALTNITLEYKTSLENFIKDSDV